MSARKLEYVSLATKLLSCDQPDNCPRLRKNLFLLTAFVTATLYAQLEFTLSDGSTHSTHKYGGDGGEPFTVFKQFENDVCLGFYYYADQYLNAISVRLEIRGQGNQSLIFI